MKKELWQITFDEFNTGKYFSCASEELSYRKSPTPQQRQQGVTIGNLLFLRRPDYVLMVSRCGSYWYPPKIESDIRYSHYFLVSGALEEGNVVPDEVLAEYPELRLNKC